MHIFVEKFASMQLGQQLANEFTQV